MPGFIQNYLALNNENGPVMSSGVVRYTPFVQVEGHSDRLAVHAQSDVSFVLQIFWSNEPFDRLSGNFPPKNQAVSGIVVVPGTPYLKRLEVLGKYLSIECSGVFLEPDSTFFYVTAFGVE